MIDKNLSLEKEKGKREEAQKAADDIKKLTGVDKHDIAVTLGSGWGKTVKKIGEIVSEIDATKVSGFSSPSVKGHPGTISSVLTPNGLNVLVIGARTHLYEGKGVEKVVHGVRTAAATGAKIMILTNGAGATNPGFSPGLPVIIEDHINLTATSPLEGANFVDLTDLYSKRLRDLASGVFPMKQGVYCQMPGPHYETPAEVRMVKTLGADLVGMSTALEAIAARESGMEVLGLSLVTNLAAGVTTYPLYQASPLSHEEVIQTGKDSEDMLSHVLSRIVQSERLLNNS